jgi:short-subunit dehydrogenase
MTRIAGKVIWITGASSGLGEALVYTLSKRKDVKLILSARRKEELERVKGNCPPDTQQRLRILPLDLSQPDNLNLSASAAIQLFGHIDILISNAGITQRSFVKDTVQEVDRRLMEVNFFGPVILVKALLPNFIQQRGGHIAIVSSVVGKFGTPFRSAYAASKHALHGFFESLRAEVWRDRILVSIICPGFIDTPLTLSALTGNGRPLNQRDEANFKGRTAGSAARHIIRAIERNRLETYFGGREVWAVYIKRFFPRLFARIIRKVKVR